MTVDKSVQQHLTKAGEYLAKADQSQGEADEYYRHAAAEMELAKDSGATWNEIADALGRSASWCDRIVRWAKTPANSTSSTKWGESNDAVDIRKTKLTLRKSDPAKVQEIVNELPKETVYEIEKAVAIRLGAPLTGEPKVAGNPSAVVRAFDALTPEQRELAAQSIAKDPEFAEALKQNPVIRDEFIVKVMGTPKERKTRAEENKRQAIGRDPIHGWADVNDGLGEANRGLIHVLNALVKLAMNSTDGFDPDSDPLGVSHKRAEAIGRTIYEIEAAWTHTPITDKVMELRSQYADQA